MPGGFPCDRVRSRSVANKMRQRRQKRVAWGARAERALHRGARVVAGRELPEPTRLACLAGALPPRRRSHGRRRRRRRLRRRRRWRLRYDSRRRASRSSPSDTTQRSVCSAACQPARPRGLVAPMVAGGAETESKFRRRRGAISGGLHRSWPPETPPRPPQARGLVPQPRRWSACRASTAPRAWASAPPGMLPRQAAGGGRWASGSRGVRNAARPKKELATARPARRRRGATRRRSSASSRAPPSSRRGRRQAAMKLVAASPRKAPPIAAAASAGGAGLSQPGGGVRPGGAGLSQPGQRRRRRRQRRRRRGHAAAGADRDADARPGVDARRGGGVGRSLGGDARGPGARRGGALRRAPLNNFSRLTARGHRRARRPPRRRTRRASPAPRLRARAAGEHDDGRGELVVCAADCCGAAYHRTLAAAAERDAARLRRARRRRRYVSTGLALPGLRGGGPAPSPQARASRSRAARPPALALGPSLAAQRAEARASPSRLRARATLPPRCATRPLARSPARRDRRRAAAHSLPQIGAAFGAVRRRPARARPAPGRAAARIHRPPARARVCGWRRQRSGSASVFARKLEYRRARRTSFADQATAATARALHALARSSARRTHCPRMRRVARAALDTTQRSIEYLGAAFAAELAKEVEGELGRLLPRFPSLSARSCARTSR